MTEYIDRFTIPHYSKTHVKEHMSLHIIDTETPYDEDDFMVQYREDLLDKRRLQQQAICSHMTLVIADEELTLPEVGEQYGFETRSFDGECPDSICGHCWKNVQEKITEHENTPFENSDTTVAKEHAYRLRWKQKGRAREEWYDIIAGPNTTIEEIDSLLLTCFSTVGSFHSRVYGLEGEFENSSLNIFPEEQYKNAVIRCKNAAEITISELVEKHQLWEDSRLSMAYDLGHPKSYYCIIKETIPIHENSNPVDKEHVLAESEHAAIPKYRRDGETVECSARQSGEQSTGTAQEGSNDTDNNASESDDVSIRGELASEFDSIVESEHEFPIADEEDDVKNGFDIDLFD